MSNTASLPAGVTPPERTQINPDLIPQALKDLKTWMLWVAVYNSTRPDGSIKWDKRPARLGGGGKAIFASKDPDAVKDGKPAPTSHFSFDEIMEQYAQCPEATGIALAIVDGQGIVAFDADRCIDPNWDGDLVPDRFDPDVSDFMTAANCWATITPSGRGVRGFSFMPDLAGNVSLFGSGIRSINKDGRELYPSIPGGKYFVTVTTEVVDGYESMGVCPLDVLTGAIAKWGSSSGGSGAVGDMPVLEEGLTDLELVACGLSMDADVGVLDGNVLVGDRTSTLFEIAKRMAWGRVSPGAILGTFAERYLPMAMAADRRNSPDSQLDWLWTYTVGRAVLAAGSSPLGSEFEAVGGVGDGTDLDRFGGGAGPKVVSWGSVCVPLGAEIGSGAIALPPPRPVLFRDFYSRKECSLTFGYGGGGKSILTMVEALAMCADAGWLGSSPVESGLRVLYVNLDDKVEELVRRTWAICKAFGLSPGVLGDRFCTIGSDSAGIDTRFLVPGSSGSGFVTNKAAWMGLEMAVRDRGFDVVILDPLANFSEANESNSDMLAIGMAAARLATETNSSVHIVHHTRKAGSGVSGGVTRAVDIDDSRGGGALTGRVRHVRSIRKLTGEEARNMGIAEERAGFYMRVDSGLKPNYTPIQFAELYELESIDLNNADAIRPSDKVGVPKPFAVSVSVSQVADLWNEITSRPSDNLLPSSRKGSAGSLWYEISDRIGMPYSNLKEVVDRWISDGYLVETEYKDCHRHTKKGLAGAEVPPEVFETVF